MAKKTAQDQTIQELQEFQSQVLDLLKSYQKNRLVDAGSKQYQDNLEKLLKQINTAVATNGPISKRDAAHMSKQLELAEKSYSSMKDQHTNDKKFQEQFIKTFGKEPLEGSLTKSIAQTFGKSMSQFSKTFGAATAPIRKNAVETAMFELTGPFGAFVKQTINTDAIKQYFQERKQNKQQAKEYRKQKYQDTSGDLNSSVKGIFAGGSENVPATGSYYLHKGERVVAPEQNKDLSEFLGGMKNQHSAGGSDFLRDIDDNVKKANRLIEEELADSYFDPILENDDRLFIIGQKDKFRFNKRLFENLETIELGIFNVGQSLYGFIIRSSLFFKRFLRHPIFYSLDYLFEPVFMGLRGIYREFFGKKKTEEQELKESVDNIYEFLVDQERKSHKTFGQQILKRFVNSVVGLPFNAIIKMFGGKAFTLRNAQRTQEDIEEHGHARGWRGIAQRLHLMGFGGYLKYGKQSQMARENDERYRPTGYLRDLRYAGLHSNGKYFKHSAHDITNVLQKLGILGDEDFNADFSSVAGKRKRDARGRYVKEEKHDRQGKYMPSAMTALFGQVSNSWKQFGERHFGKNSFMGKTFTAIKKSTAGLFFGVIFGLGKLIATAMKNIFGGTFATLASFVAKALSPEGLLVLMTAGAAYELGTHLYKAMFTDAPESPVTEKLTDMLDSMLNFFGVGNSGSGDKKKDALDKKVIDDKFNLDRFQKYAAEQKANGITPDARLLETINDWGYQLHIDKLAADSYQMPAAAGSVPAYAGHRDKKSAPTYYEIGDQTFTAEQMKAKAVADGVSVAVETKKLMEQLVHDGKKNGKHLEQVAHHTKAWLKEKAGQAKDVGVIGYHDAQTLSAAWGHGMGFDPTNGH